MDKDYNVTEVELKEEEIDRWIKRLKEIKNGKEHHHLEYENGEILVHKK